MKINLFINKSYLLLFLFLIVIPAFPQEVPHPANNTGIYDFLDELATDQIISINSAIKPWSRLFIAKRLEEAQEKRDQLSVRQQKELDFYMLDFGKEMGGERLSGATAQGRNDQKIQWFYLNRGREGGRAGERDKEQRDEVPLSGNVETAEEGGRQGAKRRSSAERKREGGKRLDLFYYRDSLFSLTVNPILGGEIFSNSSGTATYWRNGIEARGYIQNWGFYASLRDNHEKPLLGLPSYLNQRAGGHLKGSTDWSEMQGGITYSWKWGSAGLVKDNIEWGNNYNDANIFSGRNPSFIQLKLQLTPVKWFSFNYFHGWLNSMVVDSSESYWVTNSYGTDYREVYHRKFLSANMFTITPADNLNISAGNSIVYDNPTVNPAYMFPLFFYKSVDHSVSSGIDNMNSQMFFDISLRQIRHLHLYATLFLDELKTSRIFKNDEWNCASWKTGFRLSNFPFKDISLTTEFTYSYPLTFQHYVPTLTFESNEYNLGHYLKDNSREWFISLDYRPARTLDIKLWLLDAIRGPDYTELGTPRVGNPPLESIEWRNTSFGLTASYQIINDLYIRGSFVNSDVSGDVRWSPEYFYGRKTTFNAGVTFGF